MQKKAGSIAVVAVLLASVLTSTICLRLTQASGTTLYVNPALSNANIHESFTINIQIENVVDLFSYEAKLGFDNTVIQPIAVEEGSFIKGQTTSPQGTFFLRIIEEDFVHVACTTLGNYPGVSGSGTLFKVTFNAVRTGASDLHLFDSILLNSSVAQIPHDTADGTVRAAIPGDVNLDGVVNIIDLTIVSLSYGLFIGEPGYNPEADINEDGIVDMKDLSVVAFNLGKTDA